MGNIPVTVKAMFFTTELNETTEKGFNQGFTAFVIPGPDPESSRTFLPVIASPEGSHGRGNPGFNKGDKSLNTEYTVQLFSGCITGWHRVKPESMEMHGCY